MFIEMFSNSKEEFEYNIEMEFEDKFELREIKDINKGDILEYGNYIFRVIKKDENGLHIGKVRYTKFIHEELNKFGIIHYSIISRHNTKYKKEKKDEYCMMLPSKLTIELDKKNIEYIHEKGKLFMRRSPFQLKVLKSEIDEFIYPYII
jgi:hypothetical protein